MVIEISGVASGARGLAAEGHEEILWGNGNVQYDWGRLTIRKVH